MAQDFDAILIGSGHNALASALHLSVKGWRVAIFEQAPVPGGAVKSGEYTLPGFRHDWAAMNLSLFAGSAFFKRHGDELRRHGLEFSPVSDTFASVFPDHSWLGVSTDTSATTARIGRISARDAQTWERLVSSFPTEAPHLFGLLGSPMKLRALAYFMFKTLRAKGIGGSLDMMQFLLASPRDWLSSTFEDERVRSLLAAWGMHLDFAPDIAGGAIFPYLEAMANQSFGMVLGKGGADTITRSLVAAIESRGGRVECDVSVNAVLRSNGRATGVELSDGRRVNASRAVIAGVSPSMLARLTGESGDARFDKAMESFSHAPGTMMIHLAVSALPDWSAGPELAKFAYVHLAPDMDQMARTYAQAKAGLLPDEPVIVVGQPTVADPTRAPDGKHCLWMQVRMVPGSIRGDAKAEIGATDWQTAAIPFADRALGILERYAPGTRQKILGQKVVSPLDLQADNPNLVGGDQLCGSHHLAQHFLFRPTRGHADGSTPIQGLYLTGAAVWPGAGTGAGSGYLLAQKLAGN